MRLEGANIVITGAAGGIGAAMARRFAAEGAAAIVLSDRAGSALDQLEVSGTRTLKHPADVSEEAQVHELVAFAERELGSVDLFCANAGIATGAGLEATADQWELSWQINTMAHVYSARAALPGMLARGSGYLLHTISAAGLLTGLGDAPYTVTKHAAVGFAEWLAATYGDQGIRVSALCPQGVRTPLLMDGIEAGHAAAQAVAHAGAILEPDEVADSVVAGLAEERFVILPHPEVAEYCKRKAADPDRWLAAVRRLR
jgi:NAD(P)-dependent dehydrogenase (short-subunit alcohol dehydrogenase family)